MKKIILLIILLIFLMPLAEAKKIKNNFEDVIAESGVDMDSIAVSIKNVNTNKKIYSLNDKILMNPASVQKLLTLPAIVETLGDDYEFSTDLYSRGNNQYLIKLGADPYLSSKDLKALIKTLPKETTKIYIDDSALDNKTWGEGWQWDDDMNVLMPRFSSYNLDKNLIKLTIIPTQKGQFAKILNPSKYPLVFFNNIVTSDKTELDVHRDSTISPNTLVLKGTVARPTVIYIPTADLKRYFNVQLTHAMEERSLYLKETISVSKLKDSDTLETSVKHNINNAISDVLRNSNNMVAETLFKLAGAKHIGAEYGSDAYGIKMFNDYCVKNNLDNSRIRITDASGVSKNNHVSADFITDFLGVNKDNKLMEKLPAPGEGTLTHRMLPLKDSLKAKTGTLSDISTIAGYLTSKSGKKYAFCIMINDMKLTTSDKKMLEDFIIREAYLKL